MLSSIIWSLGFFLEGHQWVEQLLFYSAQTIFILVLVCFCSRIMVQFIIDSWLIHGILRFFSGLLLHVLLLNLIFLVFVKRKSVIWLEVVFACLNVWLFWKMFSVGFFPVIIFFISWNFDFLLSVVFDIFKSISENISCSLNSILKFIPQLALIDSFYFIKILLNFFQVFLSWRQKDDTFEIRNNISRWKYFFSYLGKLIKNVLMEIIKNWLCLFELFFIDFSVIIKLILNVLK